jgi:hypothetical protein
MKRRAFAPLSNNLPRLFGSLVSRLISAQPIPFHPSSFRLHPFYSPWFSTKQCQAAVNSFDLMSGRKSVGSPPTRSFPRISITDLELAGDRLVSDFTRD